MSLSQKKSKRNPRSFKRRFKPKKFRKKDVQDGSKAKSPKVFDRRGDGYLTPHLFSANEQELRDSLKVLDAEILVSRKRSSKKKRLIGYKKIIKDRMRSLGYFPDKLTRAQVLGFESVTQPESESKNP